MEGRIKEDVPTARRLWRSGGGIGSAAKATKRDPGELLPCEDGVTGTMPYYSRGHGISSYQRTAYGVAGGRTLGEVCDRC